VEGNHRYSAILTIRISRENMEENIIQRFRSIEDVKVAEEL